MRLGIRRKLIGTLMLVGLLPLIVSLVVILAGGAVMRFRVIRELYDDTAVMCADRIANALIHEELERLVMITRLPRVDAYVQAHSATPPVDGELPQPSQADKDLEQRWASLNESAPEVDAILHNEAAQRLTIMSHVDAHLRHVQIANTRGELIAADAKTDNYYQGDEEWFKAAYDQGRGRLYISTITISNGGKGKFSPGERVVELAVPIYTATEDKPELLGILKDELSVSWLLRTLQDNPASRERGVLAQLVDLNTMQSVYTAGDPMDTGGPLADKSVEFFRAHRDPSQVGTAALLRNGLVIGAEPGAVVLRCRGAAMGGPDFQFLG
jgi:hypothetical protein